MFGIFLGLKKAYNSMDQYCCLKNLHNVGIDKEMVRLIVCFWKHSVFYFRLMANTLKNAIYKHFGVHRHLPNLCNNVIIVKLSRG